MYLSCDTKKFHDNESTHILHNFWTSTHRGEASPFPPGGATVVLQKFKKLSCPLVTDLSAVSECKIDVRSSGTTRSLQSSATSRSVVVVFSFATPPNHDRITSPNRAAVSKSRARERTRETLGGPNPYACAGASDHHLSRKRRRDHVSSGCACAFSECACLIQ